MNALLGIAGPEPEQWPLDCHVLVIDDEAILRTLRVIELESVGCVCYKADSPALALKILRAGPKIGVVIVDYDMPGMDLAALISDIKANVGPDLKIVGNSGEDVQRDFAALGVDRFLRKPWQMDELLQVISA